MKPLRNATDFVREAPSAEKPSASDEETGSDEKDWYGVSTRLAGGVEARHIVTRTLAESGYTVLTAPNPDVALLISGAPRRVIHLVLSDVVLPGRDGTQLVERLKILHPEAKVSTCRAARTTW
jgi:hypothetical protein